MHDKLSEIKKDSEFVKTKELMAELKESFDLDLINLFELVGEKEIYVPLSIFSAELSALETVCKYLHENLSMSFKRIAGLMNRSEKTIWQAFNNSLKKYQKRFVVTKTQYLVPVSALSNRQYSNLESVVLFVKKNYGLKFSEIGALLHRDQRTIWTVHARAMKKRAE